MFVCVVSLYQPTRRDLEDPLWDIYVVPNIKSVQKKLLLYIGHINMVGIMSTNCSMSAIERFDFIITYSNFINYT